MAGALIQVLLYFGRFRKALPMWRHEFDEIELPYNIFTQSFSSGYHSSSSRHYFCASFELPPSLHSFRFSHTFSFANQSDI